MLQLPTGTVTLLFTDIEGSTQLLQELGERYGDVLAEHRRLIRDAASRQGGVEVDTQGDAFFIAFPHAQGAIAAAREAQERLAGGAVRVRMGIHTGEPALTDDGYVGIDVHRAARIMAAAHGGQVLVSATTRALLDADVELRDLGEHRLKDLTAPQRLYQLGEHEFPPPKTLYRANLPVQANPLVGRTRELDEAGHLLRTNRLVTLTGPGGSGKTRLALQLAAETVDEFPDGVFWVPLQALRDPALVERAIAAAVGAEDGLIDHVANKRLLVLLDNFEQVVDAAPTVSALLSQAPAVKALITSREPLHIESEQRYPVEPLPDDDAATLFVVRAQAVSPSFQPTATIREICARLDGLPLAIELAAARVALLDTDEILVRLDRRLPLLASRTRDAPERQRTLRSTIEWSYELLDTDEQELFTKLAVFRGSFTVEAAEAVCHAGLDALESLVVKSLVRRRWDSGRLILLDTIREYALDRLASTLDADAVYRRHAEHFLGVAESSNLNAGRLRPGGQQLPIAIAEQENLRGALAWSVHHGQVELGLQIATAVEQFWVVDDPHEGRRWFERLLERPEAESVAPEIRAHALRAYGSSTDIAGDHETAIRLYEESLALFEELGDEQGCAVLLHRLGIHAMHRGELERARQLVERSHEIHGRAEDRWGLAQTVGTLGAIARDVDDDVQASELLAESERLAREVGVPWWANGMLAERACLALYAGRIDEAEDKARTFLTVAEELRDRPNRVFGLGLLAVVAAERGERERADQLWRAVENEQASAPLGGWRRHRDRCAERLRELNVEGGAAARLSLDEAVMLALETEPAAAPRGRTR